MPIRLRPVLLALAALCVLAPAAAAKIHVNTNPGYLQVYDANVENLPNPGDQCPARWQNLVSYIHGRTNSPDVMTVEQLSGTKQMNGYAAYLSKHLPGTYRGIIAKGSPKAMKSPCGSKKRYQTNAIFYRTGRLTPVKGTAGRWQADHYTGGRCHNNSQDRSIAVRQVFYDKRARKAVSVGVIHWPTSKSHGTPCAKENARETANAMSRYGVSLRIVGGDFNVSRHQGGSWYARLTSTYAYGDMICPGGSAVCDAGNWTIHHDRRIDMILGKRVNGARAAQSDPHTITFNEAGGQYSDHRAIRVRVHY